MSRRNGFLSAAVNYVNLALYTRMINHNFDLTEFLEEAKQARHWVAELISRGAPEAEINA
jgi:hypothetical protein